MKNILEAIGSKWPILSFLGLVFVIFCSCNSSYGTGYVLEKEEIEGQWIIVDALRNETPTSTLDGGIFNFQDGEFSSNVFGDMMRGTYSISGDSVYTGLRNPAYFEVVNYNDSLMTLRSTISGFSFEFELQRKQNEIQ